MSELEKAMESPTPGLTQEQSHDLNWLLHDSDWDCSNRGDAYELLKVMRDLLRAAPASPAPVQPANAVMTKVDEYDAETKEVLGTLLVVASARFAHGQKASDFARRAANLITSMHKSRSAAARKATELRKALEFYAEKRNWEESAPTDFDGEIRIVTDSGDIARAALASPPETL